MTQMSDRFISHYKRLKSGNLGEVLSHAKNYLAGNVATKAIGFISMPVFTRLMDEKDYGIVAVYMAALGIIAPISTFNATDSISRYYYEKGKSDFGHFLSSIIQFLLLIQAPLVILFLVFRESFMAWPGIPVSLSLFLLLGLFHKEVQKVFRGILVSRKMSKPYVKVNVFQSYGGFGISWLLLVVASGSRYFLRIAGVVFTQVISAFWMLWRIWRYINWQKINWSHVRYSLHFGLPRLPYVLSGVILSQFDRIMLSNISGAGQAGLYSVGYNVGGLSMLMIGAITPALMPNFYQMMNEARHRAVDKLNRKILWIICGGGIGLMLFGGFLLRLMADERFYQGAEVVPAIVMGYMFYALAGVYNRFSGYYKMTILQSLGALLAGGLNILLNYLWIPKYGIMAAAYATIVAYATQALLTWVLVRFIAKGHVSGLGQFWAPITLALLAFGIINFFLL